MHVLDFHINRQYSQTASGVEIPIRLSTDRSVDLFAKIDTGAEWCIFQRAYAEMLDLPIEEGEPKTFATGTGLFNTRGHTVEITSFDYNFETIAYFAVEENFRRNVLGLNGWLNRVRFGLIHHDSSLYLSLYDE